MGLRLSIRSKLMAGFGMLIILALCATGILYQGLSDTSRELDRLANSGLRMLTLANTIRYQDLTLTDAIRGILLSG